MENMTPVAPLPSWRARWRRRLRSIISGSPFYLLSALCILYGLLKILAPLYDPEFVAIGEKFACLGAINVYEIALVATALVIVLLRNVLDDAVSLTVLIVLFMVASAATLNVVAAVVPDVAISIGIAGIILACVKVWMLCRFVIGSISVWIIAVLAMLGMWNFLMPGILARALASQVVQLEGQNELWALGWLCVLLAGVVLIVGLSAFYRGQLRTISPLRPVLGSEVMRWVLAVLVWMASALHAYGQTWAFNLSPTEGDMLPAVLVGCVVLVALHQAFATKHGWLDTVLALAPAGFAGWALREQAYAMTIASGPAAICYPPIALIVGAVGWFLMANRHGRRDFVVVSGVYGLMAVLTFGILPTASAALIELHWSRMGVLTCIMLVMLAAVWRSETMSVIAVIAVSIGLSFVPAVREWLDDNVLHFATPAWLGVGLGVQIVYLFFRSRKTRAIAFVGSLALAAGVFYCFCRAEMPTYHPLAAGLALASLAGVIFAIVRDYMVTLPMVAPLLVGVYLTAPSSGWSWIVASFVLLGLGMTVSLMRGGQSSMAEA